MNVDAVPLPSVPVALPFAPSELPPVAATRDGLILPELEERVSTRGMAQERIEQALAVLALNQEAAFQETLARLQLLLEAELSSLEREEREVILESEFGRIQAVVEGVRPRFEQLAEEIAPLYARIALFAGWPDPDPRGRRLPSARDPNSVREVYTAKLARIEAATLRNSYEREIASRYAVVRQEVALELTQLAARFRLERQERQAAAADQARALVVSTLDQLGESALDVIRQVEAVESVEAEIGPLAPSALRTASIPGSPSPLALDPQWLLDQVRGEKALFCQVKEYDCVDSPAGARDVTQEFLNWRSLPSR